MSTLVRNYTLIFMCILKHRLKFYSIGYGEVAQCLSSLFEDLGSSLRTAKNNTQKKEVLGLCVFIRQPFYANDYILFLTKMF